MLRKRDYNSVPENSTIAEAEKIVNNYLEKMKKNGRSVKRSDRYKNKILKLCLAVCIITIIALACKIIIA